MRKRVAILNFLGIVTPASVGVIILAFGVSSSNLKLVLTIAGIIGITHLVLSIWALVSTWNERLSYYLESKSSNYRMAEQFAHLGSTTLLPPSEYDIKLGVLETEASLRADLDNRHDIKDKEKRNGLRAGLRQYRRPCVACGSVPTSMKSNDCGICGK